MKDLGEAKKVTRFAWHKMCIWKKVLQKFNINDDTNFVSTLLAPNFKLKAIMYPTTIEKHEYMSHVPYLVQLVV